MNDSVLVCCPTAVCKDYAFERYLDAYNAFEHENKQLLMVDTTPNCDWGEYADKLVDSGVEKVIFYKCNQFVRNNLTYMITQIWENVIIPYAHKNGFDWILHIESDVICPPNTIDFMLEMHALLGVDMVGHSYSLRDDENWYMEKSIGCLGWRTEIFPPGTTFMDCAERFARTMAYERGYTAAQFTNVLKLQHLDS